MLSAVRLLRAVELIFSVERQSNEASVTDSKLTSVSVVRKDAFDIIPLRTESEICGQSVSSTHRIRLLNIGIPWKSASHRGIEGEWITLR